MSLRCVSPAITLSVMLLCQPTVHASVDIWRNSSTLAITVQSAMADPHNPNQLLAATERDGLYRSDDGGLSWNPITDLDTFFISAIAFDSQRPGRIYVGDNIGQFFVSDDSGLSWQRLLGDQDLPSPGISDIREIHLVGAQRLYLLRGLQLLETRDGGDNWQSLPFPLFEDPVHGPVPGSIYTLAVAPNNPDVLVAIRDEGVYRSRDGGYRWQFSPLEIFAPRGMAISPNNPQRVVVGDGFGALWASDDGGQQWYQQPSVSLQGLSDLHFDTQGRLYASTARGLYFSDDGGISWQLSNAPQEALQSVNTAGSFIQTETQYQVGVGAIPPVELSVWPAQLLISRDAGQSWEQLPTRVAETPLPEPPIQERLYRGGLSTGSFATGVNLYHSDDGGDSWVLGQQMFISVFEEGPPIPAIDALLVWRAQAPEQLYTGVAPPRYQQADPGYGLLRSDDAGATWAYVGPFSQLDVQAILLDPQTPDIIAVGGTLAPVGMAELAWSADQGQHWQRVTLAGASQVTTLLQDPLSPETLLVGTDRGLFRVDSNGGVVDLTPSLDPSTGPENWSVVALDGAPERLATAIVNPQQGYQGIAISTDGGAHWTLHQTGLPSDRPLVGLVMDPMDSQHLWAAVGTLAGGRRWISRPSEGGSLYESLDGGHSWQALNTGLRRNIISALGLSPQGLQLLTDDNALPLQRSPFWWDPQRAGMGLALEQNGETLWGTLYYYDGSGEARWGLFHGEIQGLRLDAPLLQFTGPAPSEPWDTHQITSQPIGQISLHFQSALAARLRLNVNGVVDEWLIQPFRADAYGPGNRIWWQPSRSGQGLAVLQQGNYLHGAWFFYDAAGLPTWRLFEGEAINGRLEANLLDFSGPTLGGQWNADQVSSTVDGQMVFSLSGSRDAHFAYTREGHAATLQLQPFMP